MTNEQTNYEDFYRERINEYMSEPDELTADEYESLKDGYPKTTDWNTPENRKLLTVLAQRRMDYKRKYKAQRATDRALADLKVKQEADAAKEQAQIIKERGTYRERLDEWQHGEQASRAQLKAEIMAIRNPQKRYQAIKENIDIFQ